MKILGTISELVKLIIRTSANKEVRIESAVQSGSTPIVITIPDVGDSADTLVMADTAQTLTQKTLTAPAISSPTGLVKGDVGLGNVDNTTDLNKPVSTATQTALNLKADIASPTFTGTVAGITSTMVGLGNVDNTSDATKNSASATLLNKTTVSSTALATGALTLPTGNSTTERPTGTAAQLKGMVRYNDTDDVFEGYNELSGWSSIGGGGTTDRVTQSHAFAVGDVLYLNGATYTKARADAANTAEVVGMVSRVIDSSIFEITLSGEVSGLTGLTAGEVYFLSPITAGATTATEPSVVGQVSLPVGIASSTTTMYVQPKRGVLVGATNVRTQIALANNATTTVQNVSAYDAGELSGSVIINATASLRFFVSAQFSRNGAGTNYNVSYQASGDVPPVGFQVTITSAGLLQVVMPSVTGFTSAAISYGLDVAAVGATLPLSISARNVIGDVSGTAVPAGYIGEKVTFTTRTVTTASAGAWKGTTSESITLQPGYWMVVAFANVPGVASLGNVNFALSTSTADSSAGIVTNSENFVGTNTSRSTTINPAVYIANLSAAQSYYGKVFSIGATATATIEGYAVRIA